MSAGACGSGSSEPGRNADGRLTELVRLEPDQLQEGDCTSPHEGDAPDVEAGPCAEFDEPRVVYAVETLPEGEFDPADLADQRRDLCESTYPDADGGETSYAYLQPSMESWDEGMRSVVCLTVSQPAEAP